MSLQVFLGRLTGALEAAGVPYMLCGSVASIFHGVPRTTQDVDVVVELTGQRVAALLARLPGDDYYVCESAAFDAVRTQRQFNVIDLSTGWKADLIVRKRRPFSRVEFERRQRVEILGVPVWVASAEDTILSKLEWAEAGGSARQVQDARGVMEVCGAALDVGYLRTWAVELGVAERLEGLLGA